MSAKRVIRSIVSFTRNTPHENALSGCVTFEMTLKIPLIGFLQFRRVLTPLGQCPIVHSQPNIKP